MDYNPHFHHLSKRELRRKKILFYLLQQKKLIKFLSFIGIISIKLRLPFIKSLVKPYLFNVFVGGETLEECKPCIQNLKNNSVEVILDFGSEGGTKEKVFKHNHQHLLEKILFARDNKIPFVSIKISAFANSNLLTLVSAKTTLRNNEDADYHKVITRLHTLCKIASDGGVKILIDAEESWIQNAIDDLCLRMMKIFNIKEAFIYNTIQLYRHDKLAFLKTEINVAKQEKFFYGVKLVRGAYVEKENARALKYKYPSPIQSSKENTDIDFNKGLQLCFANLNTVRLLVGSHNKDSITYAINEMAEKNFLNTDPRIHFSQLLGMADDITFTLAKNKYNVSKYLPYGNLSELLPYLHRRIEENSSMQGQAKQELENIKHFLLLQK